MGLPWWLSSKEFPCQCRRPRFDPWLRKIPWRRKWQPTPVFFPREFHGQMSLAGYSPWGRKESDMTKHTYHTQTVTCLWSEVKVSQPCPTLLNPMDCIVHGILQARILEWVAQPFSSRFSWPRIEPGFPALQAGSLPVELPGKPWLLLNSQVSAQISLSENIVWVPYSPSQKLSYIIN